MFISQIKVIPNKNHTKCPRCQRRMVSCAYKNHDTKGGYKYVKTSYYCKTCETLFPIEPNTE